MGLPLFALPRNILIGPHRMTHLRRSGFIPLVGLAMLLAVSGADWAQAAGAPSKKQDRSGE